MENYIVMYEGTIFEKGYGQISREVMRSENISRNAKVIYAYLMSFAGNKMTAFPSFKTVSKELGFKSLDTYYKYLNELKESGLIYVEQQKCEKGKFGKNLFHMAFKNEDIVKYKALNQAEKSKKQPIPKNSITDNSITEKQEYNINSSFNINIINKEQEEIHHLTFESYYKARNKIVSEAEKEVLISLVAKYSEDLVLKSISIAVEQSNNVNLKYIRTTLEDWSSKGLNTLQQVEAHITSENNANKTAREKRRTAVKNKADNCSSERGADYYLKFIGEDGRLKQDFDFDDM